jgi:hypothetical protein
MKKILLFIAIILIIPSCNWFNRCEGDYLFKITDYKKIDFYYRYNPANGEWRKVESDNFVVKYNELSVDVIPSYEDIGITEQCSYMEYKVIDSIKTFDIYSNKDYNSNFTITTNLNKLFVTLFKGDSTVYEKLICNRLATGPSLFLNQAPSHADTFIFSIHIELIDNRTFDLESRPIVITP